VVPAHERFGTDDLACAGVELRLEIRDELAGIEAVEDFIGDALGADDFGFEGIVEEFVAVAAARLGPVERDIGIDEKTAGIDRAALGGNANRHAEAALMPAIEDGAAHFAHNGIGDLRQTRLVVGVADHDELVAADTGDEIIGIVDGLDAGAQHFGDMHQHGIASGMTKRIVDLLEAIEVDMQQRQP